MRIWFVLTDKHNNFLKKFGDLQPLLILFDTSFFVKHFRLIFIDSSNLLPSVEALTGACLINVEIKL